MASPAAIAAKVGDEPEVSVPVTVPFMPLLAVCHHVPADLGATGPAKPAVIACDPTTSKVAVPA
jgi:hypothetical protein